ncbi:transposase [Streptomyces sviceus]|uniref:transposase n=1 Tax=Streptomyces sviceus TaxID=285530 RepID=UPI003808531F
MRSAPLLTGIKWRAMPTDFPPREPVYAFFRRWRDHGLVKEFHDRLRGQVREKVGAMRSQATPPSLSANQQHARPAAAPYTNRPPPSVRSTYQVHAITAACNGDLMNRLVAVAAEALAQRSLRGRMTRSRRLRRPPCSDCGRFSSAAWEPTWTAPARPRRSMKR